MNQSQTKDTKWMQTFTGGAAYPLDLKRNQICIKDIAHALSNICRFGGHCNEFYSVAEHSIRVANLVPPKFRLYALIHDAAEAYIGDIIFPIKGSVYFTLKNENVAASVMEDVINFTIIEALGLSHSNKYDSINTVKYADLTMLAAEVRDLMKTPPSPWGKLPSSKQVKKIVPLSPVAAKNSFLRMWNFKGDVKYEAQ